MKTLVFSIIQSILTFIIPQQLVQAVSDFFSKPPAIEGESIAAQQIPEKPINFPASELPTVTVQPPPLIGDKIKPVVDSKPVTEVKKLDPPLSLGQKVLNLAMTKMGDPYVWGATGPDAFDCSGLVYWSYAQFGVHLHRVAIDQASDGHAVSTPAPGDIVVLNGGSHVGLYAGDGMVLNAPTFGQSVKLSPMSDFTVYAIRRI